MALVITVVDDLELGSPAAALAEFVRDRLSLDGHEVLLLDSSEELEALRSGGDAELSGLLGEAQGVVLAAVAQGAHQSPLCRIIEEQLDGRLSSTLVLPLVAGADLVGAARARKLATFPGPYRPAGEPAASVASPPDSRIVVVPADCIHRHACGVTIEGRDHESAITAATWRFSAALEQRPVSVE